MMRVGGFSPFFKQKDYANNIKELVDRGIAFNISQRAFLETISDKIATTFNATDATLLRLVRIQQEDTTAGRLGMEAALNSFLNNMYESTEYLKDVAGSVRASLEEMSSLMTGVQATEVEYQVQKWLGSMYSVGMSQQGVQSIANAFGQIAAGDVNALSSESGNLMIMAANAAGIPITELLTAGIDANTTNTLFTALSNYLANMAESTKDNKIMMQQMAGIFGLKASDLRAAENLKTTNSIELVTEEISGYDGLINKLYQMAGSMGSRVSMSEKLTNAWENAQYSLASSIAKNPIMYGLAKGATLLEDLTGGIDLPFLNVMGFGVDLNTSVAQLMRLGALSGGILGSVGDMIGGLASGLSGKRMLQNAGIQQGKTPTKLEITSRGGAGVGNLGTEISESGYIGNGSGDDMKNATMEQSEKDKNQMPERWQQNTSWAYNRQKP